MTEPSLDTLAQDMLQIGQQARTAAKTIRNATDTQKSKALLAMADLIEANQELLQTENLKDVQNAEKNALDPALVDRLKLSDHALNTMATGLRQIAAMDDPVGSLGPTIKRPNGMDVAQMRVPLGVIGIIYESRPNVTIDAAALCLKSGNATILRGGSEAFHSNQALGKIIRQGLVTAGLPENTVQVVATTDRAAVGHLITMTEFVDVIVPRGGKSLIARLTADAKVPMIKHLDGNCHVFIDKDANITKATKIAINAKTYRYGICGTMETLLVHSEIAPAVLPDLAQALQDHGVELRGCERTQSLLSGITPATESDWETEFLGPILALRIVNSIDQAIEHIGKYSSEHTESIVTENIESARRFQREVDSSSVYVNLPTCFADGFEYGLGAEIGISTNRLHARGPVGLEGLTTQKWILTGNGQLRGQNQ